MKILSWSSDPNRFGLVKVIAEEVLTENGEVGRYACQGCSWAEKRPEWSLGRASQARDGRETSEVGS